MAENEMSFAQRNQKENWGLCFGCCRCRLVFFLFFFFLCYYCYSDEHSTPYINNKNHLSEKHWALNLISIMFDEDKLETKHAKDKIKKKNVGTVHFKLKNYYAASKVIPSNTTTACMCVFVCVEVVVVVWTLSLQINQFILKISLHFVVDSFFYAYKSE